VGNGTYYTAIGKQNVLVLPDQSELHLDTDSRIRVAYSDRRRQVYVLHGKVYFSVAHAPQRPFEALVKNRVVRAIGTAFLVHVENDDVRVTVESGNVELLSVEPSASDSGSASPRIERGATNKGYRSSDQSTPVAMERLLSLGKGETVSFNMSRSSVVMLTERELVKALSWRDGLLVFTDNPLGEVIREVGRYTEYSIEIADPAVEKIKVGGRFKIGELSALFEALEAGFGIDVTYVDKERIRLSIAAP